MIPSVFLNVSDISLIRCLANIEQRSVYCDNFDSWDIRNGKGRPTFPLRAKLLKSLTMLSLTGCWWDSEYLRLILPEIGMLIPH